MRVAVIGGGIAGLSAAWTLAARGVSPLVFEGSDRVGGKLRRERVGDLILDVGAESLLARRPEAVELVKAIGLGDDLVHPADVSAQLWSNGRLEPFTRTRLDAEIPPDDISVGSFAAELMGREFVERHLEPLLGGVYAGHADRLSLHATGGSFLGGGSTSTGPVFAGVRGGVGRIVESLAGVCGDVRVGSAVRLLERDGGGWLVDGERFDGVVVATPAPASARLLASVAPRSAFSLAGVEYASVAIVSFVLADAELPQSSGFLVPPIDGTAVKAATFSTRKWPWLAEVAGDFSVVRASVGRAGETRLLHHDDADVTEVVESELRQAAPGLGKVVASSVRRWGGALPQYAVGHRVLVRDVEDEIASVAGLEVCGATYDGVGIAAVVASARAAADRLLETLGA